MSSIEGKTRGGTAQKTSATRVQSLNNQEEEIRASIPGGHPERWADVRPRISKVEGGHRTYLRGHCARKIVPRLAEALGDAESEIEGGKDEAGICANTEPGRMQNVSRSKGTAKCAHITGDEVVLPSDKEHSLTSCRVRTGVARQLAPDRRTVCASSGAKRGRAKSLYSRGDHDLREGIINLNVSGGNWEREGSTHRWASSISIAALDPERAKTTPSGITFNGGGVRAKKVTGTLFVVTVGGNRARRIGERRNQAFGEADSGMGRTRREIESIGGQRPDSAVEKFVGSEEREEEKEVIIRGGRRKEQKHAPDSTNRSHLPWASEQLTGE
ncbi:hypothetical protein C8F04DRAFT_1318572 [Mycena alexandri]|uniref:Uncharacterized protein n=1 Tax=Mycena alexandri TaxID=1745969 RepID=A0AAD6S317_9AGAR|nr:hypothetical protein C8F04DRAFT_1318572 [Mycena alexandri]